MSNQNPAKKNTVYEFELDVYGYDGLRLSGATFDIAEIKKDGGAYAAMANAPTEDGTTGVYLISLTAAEMNADRVHLRLDITGVPSIGILIETSARTFDELAFSTVPGRGIDVETTGEVGLDFNNVKQATAPTTLTNITVPTVSTLTNDPGGVTTLLTRLTSTRAGYLDLITTLDAAIALVQAKTDLLPADPADESNVLAAIASGTSTITAQTDLIKAKTVNLPSSPAAVGSQMDLVNAPNATAVTAIQSGLATAANLTTVLNRLGSFTGTGVNTVMGFMRAMFNKTVSLPSDLVSGGLTGDNMTDSLEALRDRGDAAWTGGGGSLTADEIADEVQTRTIAAVTTVGSVTGSVGSVTGAVGSVTGNIGGNVNGNVVGTVPDSAGTTTLLSRLTAGRAANLDVLAGWAGTLLTALRAMTRKDTDSVDLAGTYDSSTDSLEAVREKVETLTASAPVTQNFEITES